MRTTLLVHVIAGALGLLSGYVALYASKGASLTAAFLIGAGCLVMGPRAVTQGGAAARMRGTRRPNGITTVLRLEHSAETTP